MIKMMFALVILIISCSITWSLNTSTSCPPILNITMKWIELYPFMSIYSINNETELVGFLPYYITNVSNNCGCPMFHLTYQEMNVSSSEEIEIKIRSSLPSSAPELYFPIFGNRKESTQYQRPFLALFRSPGPAIIDRTHDSWEEKVSWISMILKTWSTLSVCLLLGIMAGFIVWAIEHKRNPDDFPSKFPHGALAGIWWSFVTMTTVGYGDKTARTLWGRMFAVFWMVLGTILMSMFTGQITAKLTSNAMASVDLMDKKIAVPKGMTTFIEQEMNLGGRYFDMPYREMKMAFERGIHYLMIHDYKMARNWLKTDKAFRIVKAIDRQFDIGISITGNIKPAESFFNCVQREIIDLYQIFLARSKIIESSNSQNSQESDPFSQNLFLIVSAALLVLFVVMGILWEWKRRRAISRPSDIEQDLSSIKPSFATELPTILR